MQSKVNYTVVGIFILVLTFFLFAGILWMSSVGRGIKYKTYLVYVHDDVTGLNVESPVRFNGVKVGYVKEIHLDPNNSRLVKLVLNIEPDVRISTSTFAILNAQGITGVIYVNLKSETESAPLLIAKKGEPFPIIPSRPSLLMQLSEVLPEITSDIRHLSSSIAKVLDEQNRASIKESLKNFADITKTLSENSETFSQSMHLLQHTLGHVSEASKDFPEIMKEMHKTLHSIDHLSTDITSTSTAIRSTMQSGQHAINDFSDQVIPGAESALSNLSAATLSIHELTSELQRNPSMLIRGKQPTPPGPGEDQ